MDPDERRYHKYYQWVCFCLFFQVRFVIIIYIKSEVRLNKFFNIFCI
jgi:hypothetical protein